MRKEIDERIAFWIQGNCKKRNWSFNKLAKLIGCDPTVFTRNMWEFGIKVAVLHKCEEVFQERFPFSDVQVTKQNKPSPSINRHSKMDETDVIVKAAMFYPCQISKNFKSHVGLRMVSCYTELEQGDLVHVDDPDVGHRIILCSPTGSCTEPGRYGIAAVSEDPYDIEVVDFDVTPPKAVVVGDLDLQYG